MNGATSNLVRDLLAFIQVTRARPFDGADMDENVSAAGVRLKDPKALRCVERVALARSSRISRRT
jgi:hypothetical protein